MENAGRAPTVSVVLASYNHVKYIEEAVASVLDQGVDDIELIVVDDGSRDGTPELVEKSKDPRVRLVRLEENRRRHPRNTALSIARGKYIAFQNSDDKWKEGKLRKQLDAMEEDPGISACFTGIEIIDEEGGRLLKSWASGVFTKDNVGSASWLRRFFDSGNCLCISSAVVRADKLKAVGQFKPSLVQLSDFDLWIRLAAVGEFHVVGEELTCMRVVAKRNVSMPSPSASRRATMELVECLGRYLEQPVLGRLREVFCDVLPKQAYSEVASLGGLALYAWKRSAPHILFGNRVIAGLIDDDIKREELCRVFSADIIHSFIAIRGQVEMAVRRIG